MDAQQPIRVLCVDDHPLIRKGIASILAGQPDVQLVAEAANGPDAVRMFRTHRPDVTLMDLRMAGMDGIAAVEAIRREFQDARIIALTSYDGDQDIARALAAGVRSYLLKDTVHIDVLDAIRAVHRGKRLIPRDVAARVAEHIPGTVLTSRETEVLRLVAAGLANREIAEQLGTASGTIKIHVQNILDKLGAADRTQAVTIAIQRGVLHL